MNKPWNDELLSVYLDGELTADEQAQVEQSLASDAQLRQLHDDLRALRASLQSMPRLTLGADFAARVVAEAKRAAADAPVRGEQEASVSIAAAAEKVEPKNESPAAESGHVVVALPRREPVGWHVAVWGVALIAASMMVAIFWPQPLGNIARHDPPGEKGAAKAPQVESRNLSHGEALREGEAESAQQVESAIFSAPPADAKRQDSPSLKQKSDDAASRPGAMREVQSTPAARGQLPQEKFAERAQPGVTADDADAERKARSFMSRGGKKDGAASFGAGADMRRDRAKDQQFEALESAQSAQAVDETQVLVVRLAMPAEMIKQQALDRTLANEGIAFESPEFADLKKSEPPRQAGDAAIGDSAPAKELAETRHSNAKLNDTIRQRFAAGKADELVEAAAPVDAVYVEADIDRVYAIIEQLRQQEGVSIQELPADFAKKSEVEAAPAAPLDKAAAPAADSPAKPAATVAAEGAIEALAPPAPKPANAPAARDDREESKAGGFGGAGRGFAPGASPARAGGTLKVESGDFANRQREARSFSGTARRIAVPGGADKAMRESGGGGAAQAETPRRSAEPDAKPPAPKGGQGATGEPAARPLRVLFLIESPEPAKK